MKALRTLALGMLLASTALAQTPQKPNEFFVGIGDALPITVFDISTDIGAALFTLGNLTYGDEQLGFQVVAGYQRRLGSWAGAGVTGSWAGSKRTAYWRGSRVGDNEIRLMVLMADGRAHWYRRPNWGLYSGLGLGVAGVNEKLEGSPDEDKTEFAYNVIPIGTRFGHDWGGFAELAIGWNGILKLGISRSF